MARMEVEGVDGPSEMLRQSLAGSKSANGCILDRTGKLKMEIPDHTSGGGEAK